MILSHEQWRTALACPDCARRDIALVTFPSVRAAISSTLGVAEDDLDEESLQDFGGGAANRIEILHDAGCPQLSNLVLTSSCCGTEYRVYPVELSEDCEIVRKALEAP